MCTVSLKQSNFKNIRIHSVHDCLDEAGGQDGKVQAATYLSNVEILGSGATCKCLKLTGLTNSSKVGTFEPHRANCNFFCYLQKTNMQGVSKKR